MENQQIIRQKIYTTLYTNIEKIADIVAAELKGTDFPADIRFSLIYTQLFVKPDFSE